MTMQTETTWRKVKLGEVTDIIDGDRGSNYPRKDELLKSGYCVFLDAKNVSGTKFDFSNVQFISEQKHNLMRKGQLQRNDFVLTTRGTVGNIAYYDENAPYECMRINSGMVIFRPKHEVITDNYFYSFLIGNEFKNQVEALKTGSAQPQLPIRDSKLFELDLPPLTDQKSIADILSAFDDKIELNNKISKNLEATAQAIFKEWFVKNEKLKVKNEKLEDVAIIIKGKKPQRVYDKPRGNNLEYLLIESFTTNSRYFTDDGKVSQSEAGDVIVVMDGASSGRIFRGRNGAVGSTLAVIKPRKKISHEFLFLLLKRAEPQLVDNLTGSAIPHLDKDFLRTYPVPIPVPEAMAQFTDTIHPMLQKIVEVESENQKLAALRDLLLPKLMSGETRV